MKTFYVHYRLRAVDFYDARDRVGPVAKIFGEPAARGGVTLACVPQFPSAFHVGAAVCSPVHDNYCRATGRELALSRATIPQPLVVMGDDALWDHLDGVAREAFATAVEWRWSCPAGGYVLMRGKGARLYQLRAVR